MVQAMINLGEHEDRILNIIKGKYGFKNKSDAVSFIIDKFEQESLEPELKPEYIERAIKIQKQETIKVGSLQNLRKRYE